jgi:hypothetical protein
MHRDVTLEKIGYMMNRLGGDDEITVDDLETMVIKVFVSSFELEHGFEAALIQELVNARHIMLSEDDETDEPETLSAEEAEQYYCACQTEMYVQAGCAREYGEESASWPDALPLRADWDKKFLRELARKEVAHHLVVIEQIRAEMEKRENSENS